MKLLASRAHLGLFLWAVVFCLAITTVVTLPQCAGLHTICDYDDVSLLQVGPGLMKSGDWRDGDAQNHANLNPHRAPVGNADSRKVPAQKDAGGSNQQHKRYRSKLEGDATTSQLSGSRDESLHATLLRIGVNVNDSVGLLQGIPNQSIFIAGGFGSSLSASDHRKLDARCLINTGGSCAVQSCSTGRGHTKCESARCLCEKGCAGANGVCTKNRYKVILEDCTIRNFRYGSYLYAEAGGSHLSSSGDNKSEENHFMLLETHDGKFVIYSRTYPDHVVAISRHRTQEMVSFRPNEESVKGALTIDEVKHILPDEFIPSARDVALSFTAPPGGYDDEHRDHAYRFNGDFPVMLESVAFKRHYIYAPRVSVAEDVFTAYDDPGDGALWIFDPPLPEAIISGNQSRLQQFVGRRCNTDCHDKTSEVGIQWFGLFLLAVGIVIAVLLVGTLFFLAFVGISQHHAQLPRSA